MAEKECGEFMYMKRFEKESGVTVHFVTSGVDEGEIILQKSFPIDKNETLKTLSQKIHEIEYEIFPKAINLVLKNN